MRFRAKAAIVKGTKMRVITGNMLTELIYRYGIAGTAECGMLIYLFSKSRRTVHAIRIFV